MRACEAGGSNLNGTIQFGVEWGLDFARPTSQLHNSLEFGGFFFRGQKTNKYIFVRTHFGEVGLKFGLTLFKKKKQSKFGILCRYCVNLLL